MTTKLIETLTLAEEALGVAYGLSEDASCAERKYVKALAAIRETKAELEKQAEQWPHGATVKLRWDGYGPYPDCTGWAKRGKNGELVTAYGLRPLDESKWEVIEERIAHEREKQVDALIEVLQEAIDGMGGSYANWSPKAREAIAKFKEANK